MSATKTSLLKTIHEKCMDCTCGQKKEVDQCHIRDCPLWLYRQGKDPNRVRRTLTEAQKASLAEGRKKKQAGA